MTNLDINMFNEELDIVIPLSTSYNHKDNKIPSVTQILKHINEEYIPKWANSLGFKRINYQAELNRYANEGTLVHNKIAKFLSSSVNFIDRNAEEPLAYLSFLKWYLLERYEKDNLITPIEVEKSFQGQYFCGTIDAVFDINGKSILMDFKTSSNVSYKHFLQLAAYNYLYKKAYNIDKDFDYLCILQLDKYKMQFKEHYLDISIHKDILDLLFNSFINTYNSYISIIKSREIFKSEILRS